MSNFDLYNKNQTEIITYFNFILDNVTKIDSRKNVTFIDFLIDFGGFFQSLSLLVLALSKPFTFKTHEFSIFQNHVKKHDNDSYQHNNRILYENYYSKYLMPIEFWFFKNDIRNKIFKFITCGKFEV